jgi:uncharacterized protein YaeQ
MIRVAAFAKFANERLAFGKGLSAADEPDLVELDLTQVITRWVEVGQPDEKTVLKAVGKSSHVDVVTYSHSSPIWWAAIQGKIARAKHINVWQIDAAESQAFAALASRNLRLQCTQEGTQQWFSTDEASVGLNWIALR